MKSLPHTPTPNSIRARRREFTVANLLRDFADTTWRIAVPVVLFAGAGIWVDKTYGSKPWATLAGTFIGFGFGAWLVKLQLDAAKSAEGDDDV